MKKLILIVFSDGMSQKILNIAKSSFFRLGFKNVIGRVSKESYFRKVCLKMSQKLKFKKKLLLYFVFCNSLFAEMYIANSNGGYVGDNIASYALAKSFSLKYGIPFVYTPFDHSNLFVLDDKEKRADTLKWKTEPERINVVTESDIKNNLDKSGLFFVSIIAQCSDIKIEWVNQIKQLVQLKKIPDVPDLPKDILTIAVHIRKGNGGGEHYDGEQTSVQLFTSNPSLINYIFDYPYYCFQWPLNLKSFNPKHQVDRVDAWQTKFPPEQYYVDQLIKLHQDLNFCPLHIQIFTDDRSPIELVNRLKKAVGISNCIYSYYDNTNKIHHERIAEDLFMMSRCDILIRGQSYFSRIAELMGNHNKIIFPINYMWWEKDKLIMSEIVVHEKEDFVRKAEIIKFKKM